MTAVSLIVQPQAAHLLTDGAVYEADGTVTEFKSKVACCNAHRIVLAYSGFVSAWRLAEAIGTFGRQDEVLAALPAIARELRAENAKLGPEWDTGSEGLADFQVFVAAWSRRFGRAIGFVLSTNQAWFGPSYKPYTLAPVDQAISPPIARGGVDPATFDPNRDGLAILEEQRRSTNWGDAHFVGGFGELTSVTSAGVTTTTLISWPDEVGKRIQP